ncbi:MAG: NAD(P)H:quinone oxidoreductase [Polyangiaceae bacterium]|nr:NAD(P)H:quinone oxidoreductase [Polyangiaceae bacterium]
MAKIAVLYYSATGSNHVIARAVGEGAAAAGAEVRVRLVAETLPPEVVAKNAEWQAFVERTKDFPKASLEDLEWADGVVFGTPTRFGNVAAQLKGFLDSAGGLWLHGKLANKVYSGFTSAQNVNGGNEATLLALYQTIHHFGGIIVSTGYTDPAVFASGGNPYGVSHATGPNGAGPTEVVLSTARHLGRRVAELATKVRG